MPERPSTRALRPGKLPAALLRRLPRMGGAPPAAVLLPPAIGEDACAIALGGALVAATDPMRCFLACAMPHVATGQGPWTA